MPALMATIEAIQRANGIAAVHTLMTDVTSEYGLKNFIVSGLPERGANVLPPLMVSSWPQEWLKRYVRQGYVAYDPVARHCSKTAVPFRWADAPIAPETKLKVRRIIVEAREYGMYDGICVPVYIDGGMHGVVSLAGDPRKLAEQQRLELHMISLFAYGHLRFLSAMIANGGRSITPREAEVLKWAAAGKTASDIAVITGMSERTVNQHCENAQRRLGTSNRLHTVVEAIRHRLITL